MNRVILTETKQAAKRTVGAGRRLGTSIGEARTPIIDADSDGKCREKNGTWIPCPPGVRGGSILDEDGKAVGDDASPTVGIDPYKTLAQSYVVAMKSRLDEIGISRKSMKKQLRKMFKKASPELVEVARTWYRRVKEGNASLINSINQAYGSNFEERTGAGVIAALSPAREFQKNARDAKRLLKTIAADEAFELDEDDLNGYINHRGADISNEAFALQVKNRTAQVARLKKLAAQNGGKLRPSQFPDEDLHVLAISNPELKTLANTTGFRPVISAMAIARGGDPDKLLSGPKIRSFYSNILNPEGDRVTIDTWMYRGMVDSDQELTIPLGQGANRAIYKGTWKQFEKGEAVNTVTGKAGHSAKKLQDLFQGSPTVKAAGVPDNTGLYPEFAEAVREVAEEVGLSPAALQAIVWEVARIDAGYKPSQWEKIMKEFIL